MRRLEIEGIIPPEIPAKVIEYNLRKQVRRTYINSMVLARQRLAAFRDDYPGLEVQGDAEEYRLLPGDHATVFIATVEKPDTIT